MHVSGHGRPTTHAALILVAILMIAAACVPRSALAGSYVVSSCLAAPNGENNAWIAAQSSQHVAAYSGNCNQITDTGLLARTAVEANNTLAPFADYALWSFDAPPGAVITRTDMSAFMYRYGSFGSFMPELWAVGLADESGDYIWGSSALAPLWGGTAPGTYVTIYIANRTHLQFGTVCASLGGCLTASTGVYAPPVAYTRALAMLYGSRVTVADYTNPTLGGGRGELFTNHGWISGSASVGFDASDNVGVKGMTVAIDGDAHTISNGCDYTLRVPCPANAGHDTSFNTAALSDGAHTLTVSATDSADNTRTDPSTIFVDNTPPAAPAAPTLAGAPASQWRTTNGFTVQYANPSAAGGSPAAGSDVQSCRVDAQRVAIISTCNTLASPSAAGSNTFTVAGDGEFRARVRIHDALYTGAWSDWSPVLRFDSVVPGLARPARFNGWLSRQEIAGGLTIEAPAQTRQPASGWAGFAVTGDGTLPGTTVSVGAPDPSSGIAVLDLRAYDDGVYGFAFRALSRAGLAASDADVRLSTVRIDTHAPEISVSNPPELGASLNRPVSLSVEATDALAGMEPAPATNLDAKKGAYVAYTVDQGPETLVRGGRATIAPGEGQHSVAISAVDLAGNKSAIRSFTYTQDTVLPSGGLLPSESDDPRLIRFFVAESCIKQATIEVSTDAGVTWDGVETKVSGQIVGGAIPDPIWDARGEYTTRAKVVDCAGNVAILDRRYGPDGNRDAIGQLTLPQRIGVRVRVAFTRVELTSHCTTVVKSSVERGRTGKRLVRRRRVRVCPLMAHPSAARKLPSRTREVFGVVTDGAGKPLARREVEVQSQPKMTGAMWSTVRIVRSDSAGLVRATVRKFTSLRIRLVHRHDVDYADAESGTLVTEVTGAATIRATPRALQNGEVVRLSGRVVGGNLPVSGMKVALYGFSPVKHRWVPVRTTVNVDPQGRWNALYRFTATIRPMTYGFRIRLAPRPDWPFATGYSEVVTVRVRP